MRPRAALERTVSFNLSNVIDAVALEVVFELDETELRR
jgi:hypothetical protein